MIVSDKVRLDDIFVCPHCQKPLRKTNDGNSCCGFCRFKLYRDGEVWILPSYAPEYYYADMNRSTLRYLLRIAHMKGGIRQAITERYGRVWESRISEYALSLRRALFLEFIDLPERPHVLDYGCGFGALGLATSPLAGRVFLADSTLERVAFAQLHAQELGFDNTFAMAGFAWNELPIPRRSLDLVILNGILEWIPENHTGDAAAIQWAFLAAMQKLLKPGGYLMLAIENRFALRYIAGYKDHPGIKYTSLMPRWFANRYMHRRLGRSYRNFTWHSSTYKKQLPKLGYEAPRFMYLWPDYRFPVRACWLDDSTALNALFKQYPQGREHKLFAILGAMISRHLLYSFGVISRAR